MGIFKRLYNKLENLESNWKIKPYVSNSHACFVILSNYCITSWLNIFAIGYCKEETVYSIGYPTTSNSISQGFLGISKWSCSVKVLFKVYFWATGEGNWSILGIVRLKVDKECNRYKRSAITPPLTKLITPPIDVTTTFWSSFHSNSTTAQDYVSSYSQRPQSFTSAPPPLATIVASAS